MRVIYETVYLPWENNIEGKPWKYSGSDYYNNPKYLGSVSCKKWKDWWKDETKQHPERFKKNVLIELSDNITRVELQSLESSIQKAEDHRGSSEYFNRTNKHFNSPGNVGRNALKGMSYEEIYGKEKADELKKKRSESMKKSRAEKHWGRTGPNENVSKAQKKYWNSMSKEERKSSRNWNKPDMSGDKNPMYGRSAITEQKLRWYTNGKKVIYVPEGTQPDGYIRGRKLEKI